MPKKDAAAAASAFRQAFRSRNVVDALLALQRSDESAVVGSAVLPQFAFMCCTDKAPPGSGDATTLLFDIWCAGVAVLDAFSAGTPLISIEDRDTLQLPDRNAGDDSAAAAAASSSPLRDFTVAAPTSPNFAKHPLSEGVASLYLRLLSFIVGKVATDAGNKVLEKAYRHLIRSLSASHHEQCQTAAHATETKNYRVRRRFFTPVLTFAAEHGLPRLCLEILNSVLSAGGDAQQVAEEDEPGSGMQRLLSTTSFGSNRNRNNGGRGGSDSDEDDHDIDDDNNSDGDEAKDLPKRRSRDGDGDGETDNNAKQQADAMTTCELWESDYSMMIQALARHFAKSPQSQQQQQQQQQSAAAFDHRAYLERILRAVGTSLPLVGCKFRDACMELAVAAAASSQQQIAITVSDSTVVLPEKQNVLCDTTACHCQACDRAIAGPGLELTSEDAAELATAIKEKLILPRLIRKAKHLHRKENKGSTNITLTDEQLTAKATAKFAAFENLCRHQLDPASVIVDGANIGFYGLRAWYADAKRELLKRQGRTDEAAWARDELDVVARRSRGLSPDISPSFSQIGCAIDKLALRLPGRKFVVVLHERHLTSDAVALNTDNAAMLEKWRTSSDGQVVVAASPFEVNDDWCWMFMSLVFCERAYLPKRAHATLLATPGAYRQQQQALARPVVIMTNDLMRDHITGLLPGKAESGWKFLRFRWLHQVKCTFYFSAAGQQHQQQQQQRNVTPKLHFPPRFHTWPLRSTTAAVATNSDSASTAGVVWHIPFTSAPLLQSTAKVGLPTAATAATTSADSSAATATATSADSTEGVRLPEQLLDMLSFAGMEAKGRVLCFKFS